MSTQKDPVLGEEERGKEGGTTQGHTEGERLDKLAAYPDFKHRFASRELATP